MMRVVAVVVSYNRRDLLAQCIRALLLQTRLPDEVIVIDNASTDGTEQMFSVDSEFDLPSIHFVRLEHNGGGAGGFKEGMRRSLELSCDMCWVMDDDVVPEPDALEQLVAAQAYLTERGQSPSFLASYVAGQNGEVMNVPNVSEHLAENGYPDWCEYLPEGMVRIRSATFVSLLISAWAMREVGLPIADYFLWGDDTEYTMRLTSYCGPAFVCGKSRVTHLRVAARALDTAEETDPVRIANRRRSIRNELINAGYYLGAEKVARRIVRCVAESVRVIVRRDALKLNKVQAIAGGVLDFATRRFDLEDLGRLDRSSMRHY